MGSNNSQPLCLGICWFLLRPGKSPGIPASPGPGLLLCLFPFFPFTIRSCCKICWGKLEIFRTSEDTGIFSLICLFAELGCVGCRLKKLKWIRKPLKREEEISGCLMVLQREGSGVRTLREGVLWELQTKSPGGLEHRLGKDE